MQSLSHCGTMPIIFKITTKKDNNGLEACWGDGDRQRAQWLVGVRTEIFQLIFVKHVRAHGGLWPPPTSSFSLLQISWKVTAPLHPVTFSVSSLRRFCALCFSSLSLESWTSCTHLSGASVCLLLLSFNSRLGFCLLLMGFASMLQVSLIKWCIKNGSCVGNLLHHQIWHSFQCISVCI